MTNSKITRRETLTTASQLAAVGVAAIALSTDSGSNAAPATPPVSPAPTPGAPGSKWMVFVPDSNQPSLPATGAAVDATGISRAVAVKNKLTLVVDTMRSTYAIVIEFLDAGDPDGVMMRILDGKLRDLRDRQGLKISAIKITDFGDFANAVGQTSGPRTSSRPSSRPANRRIEQ